MVLLPLTRKSTCASRFQVHTHTHRHTLTRVVWGWGEGLAALDPAEDRLRALFSAATPSALLTGSPIPLTKYQPAVVIFALS